MCKHTDMDTAQIRLSNVEQIINIRCDGVKAKFASEIGKEPQFVSRWWATSETQKRNMGSKVARHIEEVFDLPHGWIDNPHDNYHDLEADISSRTELKLLDGDTSIIPLRQTATVDQHLRLTLLEHKEGNLMLLSTDENAYALQLVGHNPTIWLNEGWLVVVEPGTPLTPNECALLRLDSGEILLRLIVHISDDMLVVRNPATGVQDNLPRSRITQGEYAYIGIPPSKVRLKPQP